MEVNGRKAIEEKFNLDNKIINLYKGISSNEIRTNRMR